MGWPIDKQVRWLPVVVLLCAGCKKSGQSLFPSNLYMAYNEYDSGNVTRAFVASNGANVPLSNPGENSWASGIYVDGTDVYVAGYSGAFPYEATYWKNGAATFLQATTPAVRFGSVFVSGGDLYLTGIDGKNIVYWKNGIENPFPIPSNYETVWINSIFVSGADVYMAGDLYDTAGTTAAYWKNGNLVVLTAPSNSANAASIYVSGNTAYVAGSDYSPATFGNSVAVCWTNGVATRLTDTATASWANAVLVSGNDVYVAGAYENYLADVNVATYWKNNQQVNDLDIPPGPSSAYSIAVSGSTVYLGGYVTGSKNKGSASYWSGWGLSYDNNEYSSPGLVFLK